MGGLVIDRQREQCEALAVYRQWKVVETYVDQSNSATDRTKVRSAYDQMVADYKAGAFDAIICYDLDRLTRQPHQLEDWIYASELRGLALVTANGDADLSTGGGRMYARIKAAVARAEMERKGARLSAAQLQRAKQGRAPKGMCPIGYAVDGEVFEGNCELIGVDNTPLTLENSQSNPTMIPALPVPIALTDNRSEKRNAGGVGEQSRGRKHGPP